MFKKWKIQSKIIGVSVVMNSCLVVVFSLSFMNSNRLEKEYEIITRKNLPLATFASIMQGAAKDMSRITVKFVTPGNDEKEVTRLTSRIKELEGTYEKSKANFDSIDDSNALINLNPQWVAFRETTHKIAQIASINPTQISEDALELMRTDYKKHSDAVFSSINELVKIQNELATQRVEATEELSKKTFSISLLVLSIGLSLNIFLSWLLARSTKNQLNKLTEEMNNETEGVTEITQEIRKSGERLHKDSENQAGAIQSSVSAIEQIKAMLYSTQNHVNDSKALFAENMGVIQTGQENTILMTQSIREIQDTNQSAQNEIEHSLQQISDIVQMIAAIETKTKIINDIVFQTRLLSFNASVEAARAGEHGKGFAVVAEEVGKLAKTSGQAAVEISQMLNANIEKVTEIVESSRIRLSNTISAGVEKTGRGAKIAEMCTETFRRILLKTNELNERLELIATAAEEQSKGVDSMSETLTQLDTSAQKNAKIASESRETSERLESQSLKLKNSVEELKEVIFGQSA